MCHGYQGLEIDSLYDHANSDYIDRLLGGAGLRRGRRHPDDLRVGDALDFWRVDRIVTINQLGVEDSGHIGF
jgi:hypothetical protein